MKINKIILKICHFFRLRMDEEHLDDITINIPNYDSLTILDIKDNNCKSKKELLILDDIFNQIYDRFSKDSILEKRCRNVEQVWLTYYSSEEVKSGQVLTGSLVTPIPYIDGVLYNPFDGSVNKMINISLKIDEILS